MPKTVLVVYTCPSCHERRLEKPFPAHWGACSVCMKAWQDDLLMRAKRSCKTVPAAP